jgi:hypothetical protein
LAKLRNRDDIEARRVGGKAGGIDGKANLDRPSMATRGQDRHCAAKEPSTPDAPDDPSGVVAWCLKERTDARGSEALEKGRSEVIRVLEINMTSEAELDLVLSTELLSNLRSLSEDVEAGSHPASYGSGGPVVFPL